MMRGLCGESREARRGLWFRIAAAVLIALPASGWAASDLQQLQYRRAGSQGELRLQLSAPVRARTQSLSGGRQWLIDLPATRRAPSLRLPAAGGPLQSIAVKAQQGGRLQVRLTLAEGVTLRAAGSAPAKTLRFDLTAAAAVARAAPPARVALPPGSAEPPRAVATVAAAHAPREQGRAIVVAVDAGHGGEDPGASGPGGTQEKAVTLAIARQLAARLEREPGVRAVLTRSDDRFVELRDRAARARRAGADLFVSIHADSVVNHDIEGASVYVLSERGASSEAARLLADRENAADLRGVSLAGRPAELASVLMDLSQAAAVGNSAEAAGNVLTALDDVGAVRKRVVQYAGFAVLKSPDMPSMLIETAYISNPGEERKLRDAAWQSRLADAIAVGIMKYFRAHPPDGTRVAGQRPVAGDAAVQLAQR